MFKNVVENTAAIAEKKVELFKKHKGGYFVSAMLAGLYVGIGIMLILFAKENHNIFNTFIFNFNKTPYS